MILIIGISILVVTVLIVGFLIYSKLNQDKQVNQIRKQGNYVIDESNLAEIKDLMSAKVKEGMFELNMNNIWSFPDGKSSSSDAYIANSKANSKSLYFDLILDDSGDTIYTSTVLPVGTSLKQLKLEKELSSGTYVATCTYHLLNEDGTESSSLAVAVTIIIN